ncbi:hypothetical protein D3C74_278600 [compost metagenome]
MLIPDIGVNRVKNAKLAAVFGGNEQPGHRHQAKQTDRFQGDGLPAGVRTSYDNRRVLIPQLYVDGYNLFRRNQRMTALLQLEVAAVVHARKRTLQLPGQSGFGEHKIQLAQHIAVIQQQFGLLADEGGKLLQDDLDFAFLAQPRLAQLIVHRHDRFRLNEQRSARSRLVMHDPAEMGAVFRFDRNHEAVAANRNQLIL